MKSIENDCNKKLKNMIRNMKIFRIKLLLIIESNFSFNNSFFFFFIKKSVKFLGYAFITRINFRFLFLIGNT